MKSVRYLLPFVFPVWILGFPLYCYWSEFGRIFPTSQDIHTPNASWSHGLTLIPLVFGVSLLLAFFAHMLLLAFFMWKGSRWERWIWFFGSILGLANTGMALYLFANLMDI